MIRSDDILLEGCLKGDAQCQRALYEKYKTPMFRVCLRYGKNRSEAEDMLQEGFIKVFTDLHQFRSSGALGGWIRKVMVNVALMHLRKKRMIFSETEIENMSEDLQTTDDVFAEMNAKALTKIIQQLPDGYRAVFNMYVVEGFSHKEISEQLSISIGTSKSQLSKAKAMLRMRIEKIMVD